MRLTTWRTFRSSTHCLRFNKPSPSKNARRTQRVAQWYHRVRETSISSLRAIVIGGSPLEDPIYVHKNSSGVEREPPAPHLLFLACRPWRNAGPGGFGDPGHWRKLEPLCYKGITPCTSPARQATAGVALHVFLFYRSADQKKLCHLARSGTSVESNPLV